MKSSLTLRKTLEECKLCLLAWSVLEQNLEFMRFLVILRIAGSKALFILGHIWKSSRSVGKRFASRSKFHCKTFTVVAGDLQASA